MNDRAKESFASENEKMAPSLFCHDRPEQIAHGLSFVKSDGSESLKSLFKKEQMSKERRKWFPLEHKKWKTRQKHMRNTNLSSDSLASRAKHSHAIFLKTVSHSLCTLKWAIMSERANSQPWVNPTVNTVYSRSRAGLATIFDVAALRLRIKDSMTRENTKMFPPRSSN